MLRIKNMAVFIYGRKVSSALLWILALALILVLFLKSVDQDIIRIQTFQSEYGLQQALARIGVCSKSSTEELISKSEAVRQRFIRKREELIGSQDLARINPWAPGAVFFWDYFPPTLTCPYSVERVGRVGDGGKWVCGLELLETEHRSRDEPCVLYSFGVGWDSSFESEILDRTPCSVYAYDYTVNGTKINSGAYDKSRVNFFQLGLGGKSPAPKLRTLGEYMRENGHTYVDLVKIDIEGGEYDALDQIMEEFDILPFGHLNLEVHLTNFPDILSNGLQFKNYHQWWTRLEDKGLRAYTWEVNHYPCTILRSRPTAHEYSFVNIKKMI